MPIGLWGFSPVIAGIYFVFQGVLCFSSSLHFIFGLEVNIYNYFL